MGKMHLYYNPPAPPPMHGRGEGGSCQECGVDIGQAVGSRAKHEEWHQMLHDVIKEQVEEQLAAAKEESRREQLEDLDIREKLVEDLMAVPPRPTIIVDPKMDRLILEPEPPCTHCGHRRSSHSTTVGRCLYGNCGCSRFEDNSIDSGQMGYKW